MSEEWFDVVDGEDRVIGRAPRGEVHAKGLRHRAVHVLVYDALGRLFLQKRSMAKDTHPGCWDSSASGHVDAGEAYEAAAVRELREELGMKRDEGDLVEVDRIAAGPGTDQEFVRVYACGSGGPFRLHAGEIEEGRFWGWDEIRAAVESEPGRFATAFRTIFGRLRPGGAAG